MEENQEITQKEQRAREFLECMGNGKPIHQCEAETEDEV